MKTIYKKTIPKSKKLGTKKKGGSITLLPPTLEKLYLDRKEVAAERSRLKKREQELKKKQDKIDGKLAPAFESHNNRRRLSDGVIVVRKVTDVDDRICTKDMVGSVLQSGYSYPTYSESAP